MTRISSVESVCDTADNSTTFNATAENVSAAGEDLFSDPCYQDECEVLTVDIAVTLSFLVGILMVNHILDLSVRTPISIASKPCTTNYYICIYVCSSICNTC